MNEAVQECLSKLSVSPSDLPTRYELFWPICLREKLFVACVIDIENRDDLNLVAKIGRGTQIENERKCLTKMNEIDRILKDSKDQNLDRLSLVQAITLKDEWVLLIERPYAGGGEFKTLNKIQPKLITLYADRLCDHIKMLWDRYGLLHMDIKPSNIIIKYPDIPLLIDFGLSVFLNETPCLVDGWSTSYSSKNQQNLGDPCKWDDVEALCNTFYAMELGVKLYEQLYVDGPPDFQFIYRESSIVRRIVDKLISSYHQILVHFLQNLPCLAPFHADNNHDQRIFRIIVDYVTEI